MTDTLPPLPGGCLCGRVRYEATPDHRDGYYCHCRMCQLAFGNTRAAFINLRKAEVRWLGAPAYYASSKIARRGFCCALRHAAHLRVPRQRTHGPVGGQPRRSVAARSRPSTFAVESRIATWHADDGLPGERLDANERIKQRWRDAYGAEVRPGWVRCAAPAQWPQRTPLPLRRRFRMNLLHTMLRVGDLQRSIDFYTQVLGMKLLRTTERPEQKYDLAFVGYGTNPEHAEIELTYNYGVDRYELGSAYGHIAIGVPDVAATCEQVRTRRSRSAARSRARPAR